MVELSEIPKLKVAELKAELGTLGLLTTGKKAELAARLSEALAPAETAAVAETAEAADAPSAEVPAAAPVEASPAGEEAAAAESSATFTDEKVFEYLSSKAESDLSDAEKMLLTKKKRAERFGNPVKITDLERMQVRAARFGLPVPTSLKAGKAGKGGKQSNKGKGSGMTPEQAAAHAARMKARAERFGVVAPQAKGKKGQKGQKAAALPIAMSEEDKAKMEARRKRFAPPSTEEPAAKRTEPATGVVEEAPVATE